jgi:hypothetical protein
MPAGVHSSKTVKKVEWLVIIDFKPILSCYLCNYRVRSGRERKSGTHGTLKPKTLN